MFTCYLELSVPVCTQLAALEGSVAIDNCPKWLSRLYFDVLFCILLFCIKKYLKEDHYSMGYEMRYIRN